MKKRILSFLILISVFINLVIPASALESNLTGGGYSPSNNGSATSWWMDGEGLRVYLMSRSTGDVVGSARDISRSSNPLQESGALGGNNKRTKHDYLYKSAIFSPVSYSSSPITYMNIPATLDNAKKLKDWFETGTNLESVLNLFGYTEARALKENLVLTIEPLLSIHFNGIVYTLTPTEAAAYSLQLPGDPLKNAWSSGATHGAGAKGIYPEYDMFTAISGRRIKSPLTPAHGVTIPTGMRVIESRAVIEYFGIGFVWNEAGDGGGVEEEVKLKELPGNLTFNFTASPKDKDIDGDVIGENVELTVTTTNSAKVQAEWLELLKELNNVSVSINLRRTNSPTGSAGIAAAGRGGAMTSIPLTGTYGQMSAVNFNNIFVNGKAASLLKFTDDRRADSFNPDGTRRYNYSVSMSVRFIVPEGYEGEGTTKTVNFVGRNNSSTLTDYASFKQNKSKILTAAEEPALTQQPVTVTYKSGSPVTYSEIKQGDIYNEQFDAMAGTPTTRDLYFAVGGTEFLVDFQATLDVPNAQTATRTYRAFYSGTACEFKEADQAKTFTFPSPSGGGSGNTSVSSMHTGSSLSVTWSGNHTHSQNSSPCGTCNAAGWNACTVNQSAYNTALAAANAYASAVNGTVYSYTSASDKQTRNVNSWGAGISTNTSNTASNARTASGGSGCRHNSSGSCTIPEHTSHTTSCGPANNRTCGLALHTHTGQRCTAGAQCSDSHSWTIVVRWTVPAHTGCGPCCTHDLPAIEDKWAQEVSFNPFKIDKAMVWKLEQGHLDGLSAITGGLDSVLTEIRQGNPTTFFRRAAAETSSGGRLRYSLNPAQHDAASWNLGIRTNKCNKQNEAWGTGIVYNNTSARKEEGYHESSASAKDKNTAEYKEFDRLRKQLVDVTVISDILILQTSSGDQSVLYFEKKAGQVQTQQDYKPVEITLQESWTNNTSSAAKWGSAHVNRGSYNGNFANTISKYTGTGTHGRTTTVFDTDPAGSVTRTARPPAPLRIIKTGIDVLDTLPNAAYTTGEANTFWLLTTNYNPGNLTPWFSTELQPLFGNRSGYVKKAAYSPTHTKINDIVIHNPVSADYAMVFSLNPNRDQRTSDLPKMGELLASDYNACPDNAIDCEFTELYCIYPDSINHIPDCYTETTPHTNNTHEHRASCVNINNLQQAYQLNGAGTGFMGEDWGLVRMDVLLTDGVLDLSRLNDDWAALQPLSAPICSCSRAVNIHVCNTSCDHIAFLICDEPHHINEHYDTSNPYCYRPCGRDSNHQKINIVGLNSLANGATSSSFINLDWGFQVYFPTIGDFWQGGVTGISQLTTQRGKGFVNNMETKEWVATKRIRFEFDVIFCGASATYNVDGATHNDGNYAHNSSCRQVRANTWINLDKDAELFNFYCVSANYEEKGAAVSYEVTAINSPNGINDNYEATNRLRASDFTSKHGAEKRQYLDVIGRIGNLVMMDTQDWRFMNLFKTALPGNEPSDWRIQGIVKNVDIYAVNYKVMSSVDIRGKAITSSFGQDTYGTQSLFRDKYIHFPLSPDKNNIPALRNEPIRFGYDVILDISTLGKEYSRIEVVPRYYYYDTVTRTAVPVDAYAFTNVGYEPVNLHANAYMGAAAQSVYSFDNMLDWDRQLSYRGIQESELNLTRTLAEMFSLNYPKEGSITILGNADYLSFGTQARTFTGSSRTLGYEQNIGGALSASDFQRAIQRWHFKLGLPSSAVVVDQGASPDEANISKYKNGNGVILMTADIYATSDLYTLYYKLPDKESFVLEGVTYSIPSNVENVIAVYNGRGKTARDDVMVSRTH